MSEKDKIELRKWMATNPGLPVEMRQYFAALDVQLRANDVWPTTTTISPTTTTA